MSDGIGEGAARRMLADQVRALAAATLLTTAGVDALEEALALARTATSRLAGSVRSSRYEGVPGLTLDSDTNEEIWETHAAFGRANPLAPPVVAEEGAGRVDATVTFGDAYEGGPGSAYGGSIAAAFDGMLGRAVISSGRLGVTRSLQVWYLRPTPLRTPLRVEAVVGEVKGRDVEVAGRMWAGDKLTSEAKGMFTCVEDDRYRLRS